MKSGPLSRLFLALYLLLFFGYLLGPLIVMGITAFNSPGFPRAFPFECLTFEWFNVLWNDERILNGIKNSFIVGAGTVFLSVVLGLAGALMLTQIWPKIRATYYTIVIAPILIPGVVLGISTLVFWDRINVMLGWPNDSILHNGLFLTIIGQSTFIASYCMLIFIARLQRFDPGLTEAALDLGATHVQAFRKVLLPFLVPAIFSAAVIAFLASFENYNTTTFTFGKYPTLTIELAQKVRYGINPSISALAVIIVLLTVFFALVNEVSQRRKALAIANGASIEQKSGIVLPRWLSSPAGLALALLIVGFLATVAYAAVYSADSCKTEVRAEKQRIQQERIEILQLDRLQRKQEKQRQGPDIFGGSTTAPGTENPGTGTFGDVFDPSNLGGDDEPDAEPVPEIKSPGAGTFGDVFNPGNLGGTEEEEPEVKSPGAGTFGDVFAPNNLQSEPEKSE